MNLIRSDSFKDDFKKLPVHLKRRTEKVLRLLAGNIRHPSLRIKKMGGNEHICEVRVSQGYRLTLQWNPGSYLLRHVGKHDILRRP